MSNEKPEYPEHAKMRAVQDMTQAAGEFLDWLDERGFALTCRATGHESTKTIQEWMAEWQGIDMAEIRRERQVMLDDLRAKHEASRG